MWLLQSPIDSGDPAASTAEGAASLGARIRFAREQAGLTQVELAQRIGLADAQSVSNYERGRTDVPRQRLRRIAAVTGKPLAFFVAEQEQAAEQLSALERIATSIESLREAQDRFHAGLRELAERLERLEQR